MFLRLAALLATLILEGCCCGRTTSSLDLEDTSAFTGAVRIAADFAGREVTNPSQPHTSHAVELEVSGAKGSDSQMVNAGQQPVVFGGETFLAPQNLRGEFDFRLAYIGYRYRHLFERSGLGLEALVGPGYAQLGLTVTGATQRAAERLSTGGLVVGLGAMLRFWGSTSAHLRATGFASGSDDDVTSATRYDLYLAQALGRHAGVRAGYSWWNIRSRREDEDFSSSRLSPIRVRMAGPQLAFELMF
jgi:hypothetical protein